MRTHRLLPLVTAAAVLGGCAADGTTDGAGEDPPAAQQVGESEELLGAISEVVRLAPALESHYRGDPYPTALDDVLASLPDAGLTVAAGYAIAGYRYDADAVEFTLCVEHEATGAWATYDTAPMSTRETGENGGCPAL